MDNSKEFQFMFDKAIDSEPLAFKKFDRTKNVQDQLQEMCWSLTTGTYNLLPTRLFAFSDYWEKNGMPTCFFSMEQLWLAFLMRERYGMMWVGNDWVKKRGRVEDGLSETD